MKAYKQLNPKVLYGIVILMFIISIISMIMTIMMCNCHNGRRPCDIDIKITKERNAPPSDHQLLMEYPPATF